MEKIALTDLKAALERLEAEKKQRTAFREYPQDQIAVIQTGDRVVAVLTGVPRPFDFGRTDVPTPPDTPSKPAGRDQPTPRRRDPTEVLPPAVKADTTTPQPVRITVKDGGPEGMPDTEMSCWYAVESNVLRLCHADGRDLDDAQWKHTLSPYEQPRPAAEKLLKQRAGVLTPFNAAKISYFKPGMI